MEFSVKLLADPFAAIVFIWRNKMKLSARNQIPGTISHITLGATTAHVTIDLGSGVQIMSSITNEAVKALALDVGDAVWAVIKSSDVMVGKS